jgi:hypothetical protein
MAEAHTRHQCAYTVDRVASRLPHRHISSERLFDEKTNFRYGDNDDANFGSAAYCASPGTSDDRSLSTMG